MKKILSLTLSAALLSATAAPGYAIDLSGNYANDYENLETAVNGKVDSSTIFSNGVFDTQNTNANGTVTRIWNEADGGGTQIIDGRSNVKAYTGVNEGSDGTNIYVQTYAIDKDNKTGTRINVNQEGAYYTTGKNTYTFTDDDEIATKGDLKALASGTSDNKIGTDALDDTLKTAVSTVSTNTTAINTNKENITALQTTVGDASNGLVADVATLKNVVHQESDGIHIGEHSFIFDDANGKITYKDSTDTEQAIDFTTTPTVNGKAVATQEAVDAVADTVATKQDALNTDQLAAANSGITAAKVSAYEGYATTIAGKQDALNTDQLAATNSGITAAKVTAYEGYATTIAGKQDALSTDQLAAANSGITAAKVTAYEGYATTIAGKQDAISDLADIRSNASAGKSAKDTIATYGDIVTHGAAEFQEALTPEQIAAVNSGITDTKVEKYDGYDAKITTNANNITDLQNNKQNKLTDSQLLAVNSGIDTTKVEQIATNKTNIDANASAIATINGSNVMTSGIDATKVAQIGTNTNAITALDGRVTTNTTDIATINNSDVMHSGINATKVAQYDAYEGRINDAEDDIDALQTAVGNLNYTTENYVQDGDDLTTAVSSLDSHVKTNADGIEANKTNIGNLLYASTNYVASGDNLTTAVGKLDGQVKTNADNIATNTADIAALGDRMDDAETNIGDMNFDSSEYLVGANSLTEAANLLDTQVAINEADIAANKAAIDTLNADVDTTGSVLNSIRENAANAKYANGASGLTATTLQGAIDENAANIGGLNYTSTNYVASGDNLTTAVGKLDGQVKTNADGIATNATNIGSMDFTGTNYLTGVSSLTDATKALDGQVKTNADNIGDMSFTGTSAAGATTLTGAVNKLDAAIGNKTFITNASGATDMTDAINKTNTALGDVSTLDGYNITTNNVTGAVNELDAAIGDVSTLAAAKGRDVKTTADVTSAIKAMDADFHRADDGRIHIGTNSFILDDSNGNFSYEDPSGVERPINFTQTPTVNGTPLATTREVDHLRDESRTGIASVAALTALQPLGIESGRLQFAVGSGFYQGESALAAGANYYVTDNLVLNAGGAMDTSLDNHVIKAGLSVGFFKPKKARTINANNVVINAAQHTTVKASKDVAYVTPEQLKALMDRIEVLEKELAKRK